MTLPSINTTTTLPGNGSAILFDFSFKVWEPTDLEVWITNEDNVVTKMASNWSVALNSNQDANPGGTVRYPVSGDPLTENEAITIKRGMPFTQLTKFSRGQGFDPVVVGIALDRIKAELQELLETIQRSIRVPVSMGSVDTGLPAPAANNFLAWNAEATALINAAGMASVPVSTFMATLLDDEDADNALTTLGISSFAKTLLDDADVDDALTTLGIKSAVDRWEWVSGLIPEQAVSGWALKNTPADNDWCGIEWSPELGLFVAVAGGGTADRAMISSDGNNWTGITTPTDGEWNEITWSPQLGLFAACGNSPSGTRVMTSPDGVNWTLQSTPVNQNWVSILWVADFGLFIALAYDGTGNQIMTSDNGTTWTLRSTPAIFAAYWDLCYSPDLGVVVATGAAGHGDKSLYSTDGINWSIYYGPDYNSNACAWSPKLAMFVTIGSTGAIKHSVDGMTWTYEGDAPAIGVTDLLWVPEFELFVGCTIDGGNGYPMVTSPDGLNWSLRESGGAYNWRKMAWSHELAKFVALNDSATGTRVQVAGINFSYSG